MEPANKEAAPAAVAAAPESFETWALWLKDNVEAFVVAFIIALVVRCFCLEVFKIPTGSMTPTLLGDHPADVDDEPGPDRRDPRTIPMIGGDRIMVSKFMYHLFPLQRFDVVVFKFPLDTSRNFIKRLVGMPNEKLLVQEGDLYFCPKGESAFRIARKPLRVQESIWIPVYPNRMYPKLNGAWLAEPPSAAKIEEQSAAVDTAQVPGGEATVQFVKSLKDAYEGTSWTGGDDVGDLRLAATVTWRGGQGGVLLRIESPPDCVEGWLPASGEAMLRWESDARRTETRTFPSPIGDGKPHDVALLSYDGLAHLRIDGEMVAEFSYRSVKEPIRKGTPRATFVVKEGKATLERVTLHRDVYYLSGGGTGSRSVLHPEETPVDIPDKSYFMMGDNSPNSKDSRLWNLKLFKLRDGRVIRVDSPTNVKSTGEFYDIRDVYGVEHHIARIDVDSQETAPASEAVFVREELIVGKAFYVWWPLNR
ncbi:MAG: S26 family signal peptidase, partial [Planctomycetota bacterium]